MTKGRTNIYGIWEKYRRFFGLLIMLFIAGLCFLYIYKDIIIPETQKFVIKPLLSGEDEDACYIEAKKGDLAVSQAFFATADRLLGLRLHLLSDKEQGEEHHLKMAYTLSDGISGEPVTSGDIEKDFSGACEIDVVFEQPIENAHDRYLILYLGFSEECAKDLKVAATYNEQYGNLRMATNQEFKEHPTLCLDQCIDTAIFLGALYKVFVVLFLIAFIIFYVLVWVKKAKIETVYLFSVLTLGFFYCMLIIPFSVPDERTHADCIYRLSNKVMGIDEPDREGVIYKRVDDAGIELNNECGTYQYYVVYKNLFKGVSHSELVEYSYVHMDIPMLLYAPSIFCFVLCRLLGVGTIPMLMLARLMTLLAFALATWWGMKRLPFGKAAMFIICILPITLQQAASMSYDSMVNAGTLLFISLCFSMIFSEGKVEKKDLIPAVFLVYLLIFAKNGAYLPLILLFALIPAQKLGGKKKKWLGFAAVLAIACGLFVMKNLVIALTGSSSGAAIDTSSLSTPYTLGYLLAHPGIIFNVLMSTALLNSGFYINTMIGQRLGFLNLIVNDIVIFGYLFLLGLSILSTETERYILKVSDKIVMFLCAAASAALVVASMWLLLTPKSSQIILGVQGRYFIPVLWLVVMLFKNRRIILKKSMDSGLVTGAFALHALVFVYVIRDIFL